MSKLTEPAQSLVLGADVAPKRPPGQQHGAYLGSVRCIETLRGRCFVDEDSGCWHLRTSLGRPPDKIRTPTVWVHGRGNISSKRAAWELAHGKLMRAGFIAFSTCNSYDCVAPKHIKSGRRPDLGQLTAMRGDMKTPARIAAARRNCMVSAKGTPEQREWMLWGDATPKEVSAVIGLSVRRIKTLRFNARRAAQPAANSSIFNLAGSL